MSNKLKNKQLKQVQNQAQDGRSMVEMLGVLAIIGVLSIGGIAGYSWGMDKHVANQILNEMNLNSLQLAMLLQKGNPEGVTLSLGSPYDDENPTFSTVNYGFDYGCGEGASDEIDFHKCRYIDETRYYIEAYNLPERVAKMVVDSAAGLQYYDGYEEVKSQSGENQKDVTVFFDVDPTVEAGIPRPAETEPHETEPHYTPTPEVTEPTTTTTTTVTTTPETTTKRLCQHGYLRNGDAYCSCYDGWGGEDCSIENPCTDYRHGWWRNSSDGSGSCVCTPGWCGADCSQCTEERVCKCEEYGHGLWCGSFCNCNSGWKGDDCNTVACSGHGWWSDDNGGYCASCTGGFGGPNCETPDMCDRDHGVWINNSGGSSGYCNCTGGYGGPKCETENMCSGHGRWWNNSYDGRGSCTCTGGYGDPKCETENMCSGHGSWYNKLDGTGYCICTGGYGGTKCETENMCSGHGFWNYKDGTGYCNCHSGWSGTKCETETN